MNKILLHKLKEALLAVLPITIIILILNFAVSPMDSLQLVSFIFGAVLLILGMGLYSLGCDTSRSAAISGQKLRSPARYGSF